MAKIILDVDKNNSETVLMILKNLKSGLIKNISMDNKNIKVNDSLNKYKKPAVLEDEFIPKTQSTGKYLSKDAYKARLTK